MPQFLYKMQPVRPGMLSDGPTAQEEKVIGEHFAYLQQLVVGVMRAEFFPYSLAMGIRRSHGRR
jgi:hypothetical protein